MSETKRSNKIMLHLSPVNGGPFNCRPAMSIELEPERVLCNDVTLPWDFNPHNTRLWVIGHEFGAVCAVWANCEQDALDEMVDSDLGQSFLIEESDADDESARLGNAGEPANLDNAWVQIVSFDPARDCRLLCQFAEARGNGAKTLDA